ncbi:MULTISPECIES: MFS transporter [Anaeromyxobacter]|uniref:MFS transporter n=1 Tax=Anaeromyxobacter TaxID=161492 RepID=UPI001F56A70D|nr:MULTISPECIES: MFS transporter [unclassified Anaeromyxobacter]
MHSIVRLPAALLRGLFLAASAPALGLLRGAPPAMGGGRATGSKSRVRSSLRASSVEGAFAELVAATAGPTVLTAWALHLGATPLEVGLIAALPQLAQVVQLPAAWTTATFGRRRVAVSAVTLSRQALLPLAALPFLPLSAPAARALLLVVAALSAALAVVGNNAWVAWMGELVPERLRGRYFGRRTALCTAGGTVAGLGVARLLDAVGTGRAAPLALAGLALASSAFGAVTTALMKRQHEPPAPSPSPPSLGDALRPLRDRDARAVLVYQVAWNASVGLAGGYFTLYLLHDLRAGFMLVAAHAAIGAVTRFVTAPLWGRVLDRAGARPVLAACSFAAAGLPLLWLASSPDRLWPIALDAAIGGAAWGGHALATLALPLEIGARRDRPFHLAAFAMAGGLAYAAAVTLGGLAAVALPPSLATLGRAGGTGLELVFVVSALGRLASALLALRTDARGAVSLAEVHRAATGAARGALAYVRILRR